MLPMELICANSCSPRPQNLFCEFARRFKVSDEDVNK